MRGPADTSVVSSFWVSLLLLEVMIFVRIPVTTAGAADDVAPVPKGHLVDDDMQAYLMKYGYLSSIRDGVAALRTEESLRAAIREMQEFANIPVTGELDDRTRKLMKVRRCALPDREPSNGRPRRYALHHGRPWDHLDLTWTLVRSGIPSNIQWEEARQVLAKALDLWAKHSKLTFTEVHHDKADIVVSFFSGDHGDNFTFDGRGQVLAHAFFPGAGKGGDAHFDSDEYWVTTEDDDPNAEGTSLFKVAAHEFGHSLGLSHSSVDGALMTPYYQAFSVKDYDLPEDDKRGIRALYGVKDVRQWGRLNPTTTTKRPITITWRPITTTRRPTTTTRWPTTTRRPISTTTRTIPPTRWTRKYYTPKDNDKNRNYHPNTPFIPKKKINPWRETNKSKEKDDRKERNKHTKKVERYPPIKENEKPDMCKTSFDAAALIRGEVFFFKDRYFWRIGDRGLYIGYPFLITSMFTDLPSNLTHIDAVYERPDNKIVIFIDRFYYVFSMTNRIKLEPGYPKPLTDLGLPSTVNKIDGASVWGYNGKTFFYSEHFYWRVDDDHAKVELDYPRLIKGFWRGLPNDIDAVFQWKDGKTYFLKGKHYFKFNDEQRDTEKPKPIGPYFLGCQNWSNQPEKEPYTAPEHSSAATKSPPTLKLSILVYAIINLFR
ncbi:matrix metalloproteinase-2-like [Onthophagus taurus]|uniref:matrix metalloproteinase-2-like n=1 Tax=Onthophagus taurus TaxID=166361 RepID=UPI000C20A2A7|nr:matrix metalloproteinase-2-like [Onthophagus taurus]